MFPPSTRVLIVDDMKTMRLILSKYLSEIGLAHIIEADDGTTAWDLLEANVAAKDPIGLVIADWNMPKMMGIELLQKVREHTEMRELPFIFVTAETDLLQVAEAAKYGVSDYVTKPFTSTIIRDKLETVFSKTVK